MENISKDFYGTKVLENVNLTLHRGEILGLVGENGAGKSTLMKILFGMPIITQTKGFQGKIYLDGKEVNFTSPFDALDAGIGMVHQEFSLLPSFTATENILLNRESVKYNIFVEFFGERIKTLDRVEMKKRAEKAVTTLGVDLDLDMFISEMPVGHKQFTEIARELNRDNVKLIVLDEPTAVLTESEATVLLKTLKHLAQTGISIIFISHRLQEILDIADKILVLRDGKLVKETPIAGVEIRNVAEWMVGREMEEKSKQALVSKEHEKSILKIEHLWVDMPGEMVKDLSVEIKQGEIFGFGGLAGQGKLGIPNGIMGLYPAGGKVFFNGKELKLNNPKFSLDSGMAFVSEDRRGVGLLLDEPIDWNIAFTAMQAQNKYLKSFLFGLIRWRDDKAIQTLAMEYVKMLDIKCTSTKQHSQELSGGNQQKVCLAKAFAVKPEVLFVSEPTRGIDIGAKRLVIDTLKRYNQEYKTTILMISSELEELRAICDRIAIIDEGRISGILPASSSLTDFGLLMIGKVKQNH